MIIFTIAIALLWLTFAICYVLSIVNNSTYMPQHGTIIGYKKIYYDDDKRHYRTAIVELEITDDVGRYQHYLEKKCRAASAKVLSIRDMHSNEIISKGYSSWDPSFYYYSGRTVEPVGGFDKAKEVCGSGIHFFMRREDAESYNT